MSAPLKCGIGDLVVILSGRRAGQMGTIVASAPSRAHRFAHPLDTSRALGLDWVVKLFMPPEPCLTVGGETILTNELGYRDSNLRPVRGMSRDERAHVDVEVPLTGGQP